MKNFRTILALGVFVATATLAAHADPIMGAIGAEDANGSFAGSSAGGSVTFGPTGFVDEVGTLAGNTISPYFTVLNASTFNVTPFAYGAVGTSATVPGSGATSGGVEIFSTTEDGETLTYYITGESTLLGTNDTALNLSGVGYFTETGGTNYTPTVADFTLTGSTVGQATFEIGGTAATLATPEPSSLILLGTGLAGAAGTLFRRRRSVA